MDKKYKVRILIAILSLCLFIVFSAIPVFASFTFRPESKTSYVSSSAPASAEVIQYLLSTYTLQVQMGFLPNFEFVLVSYNSGSNRIQLYGSVDASSVEISYNGSSSLSISSAAGINRYFWDETNGFFYNTASSPMALYANDVIASSVQVPNTNFYDSFIGLRPNYSYGTDNFNAFDVYSYYNHIYNCSLNYEEDVSIAYDDGWHVGFDTGMDYGYQFGYQDGEESGLIEGESIGYQEGYLDGFDTGMDWGYQFGYESGMLDGKEEGYNVGYSHGMGQGYDEGESVGYVEGYDDGYNTGYVIGVAGGQVIGYETGFDVGFETGYNRGYDHGWTDGYMTGYESGSADQAEAHPPGPGEIVYRDSVSIDVASIISGISSVPNNIFGNAFDFELFGINIAGILKTLLVIAVVGFIIGFFIKKRS